MANYKVIQDIEAEDKLLGPLTLRQFIYAAIVIVSGFIAFKIAAAAWFLALPFLPIIIFFAVLAAPFGHDQSSEVWLLAKVRFFLKPRRRIWDQSGIKQLVTITVPKQIEKYLVKDLSQTEVRSRLQALANTIDSRGWAVKNTNVNLFSEPSYVTVADESDRLISPVNLPQDVPAFDVQATDDMFDERTSPTAQHLNQLMATSTQVHKQQLITNMNTPAPKKGSQPADYWFTHGPVKPGPSTSAPSHSQPPAIVPAQNYYPVPTAPAGPPTAEEKALLEKLHAKKTESNPAYGNMRTIQPLSAKQKSHKSPVTSHQSKKTGDKRQETTPEGVNPAIIELANNDDLNVATIARQADKASRKKPPNDEVIVSLR